ncbi:MAG: serpin family protein [Bradymonadaceae bacterium]|nr:serpin family protein [Lujinxingiaceae bacterium]
MSGNKHWISGLLVAALLASPLGLACGTTPDDPEQNNAQNNDQKNPDPVGELLRSSLSRELSPAVSSTEAQALSEANRDFALNLYRELSEGAGADNVFMSPHSISIALAMAYGGARGETATEIAAAMNYMVTGDDLHKRFNALDLELAKRAETTVAPDGGDPFQLSVVNATWGQRDYPFLPGYLDLLAVNYGAGLRLLDFESEPEPSRKRINQWVEDQTNDRIKDLIPEGAINRGTTLVLTNAIYFKASWLSEFSKSETAPAPFALLDGASVQIDQMRQTSSFRYGQLDGHEVIELPYVGNEVTMIVVMPEDGSFESFEAELDGAKYAELLGTLGHEHGTLRFPKFSFESDFMLKDPLKKLGMELAFSENADFSGIDGTRGLSIGAVIHKSFVAVDEEGTEAAAATAVVIGTTSAPSETFSMTVDRPFLFFIQDKPTGALLFVGRVVDPR